MEGFLRTHLSAAGAKSADLASAPAGPGWRAGAVLAMTFMATRPTPAWWSFSMAGPYVAGEAKLYSVWSTSSLHWIMRSTMAGKS